MMRRLAVTAAFLAGAALVAGCSGTGAGMGGFEAAKHLMHKDTNLRVFLDGQPAQQAKLAKALKGYAQFKIKEPVSTSPKFKYEIIEPKKFGFIKMVSIQVHQKFEADFSDIADYVIVSRKQESEAQMKPGVEYDLGNLGPDFKILDRKDKEVSKVEFTPGKEYLLVLTLAADKSETIQIYFKTK